MRHPTPIKFLGCAKGEDMTPKTKTALAPNEAYRSGRLNEGSSHWVRPERRRIPQNAPSLQSGNGSQSLANEERLHLELAISNTIFKV